MGASVVLIRGTNERNRSPLPGGILGVFNESHQLVGWVLVPSTKTLRQGRGLESPWAPHMMCPTGPEHDTSNGDGVPNHESTYIVSGFCVANIF